MHKTILIPVDFSIESLNTLKLALQKENGNKVNVILMYADNLSTSITDLLFYSAPKQIKQLTNNDFNEALAIIKNRYESIIHIIRIELFHGKTRSAFNTFAEANKVAMIYVPKYYKLVPLDNGYDPLPLIKKSKFPFQEIEWNANQYTFNTNQMNAIFS